MFNRIKVLFNTFIHKRCKHENIKDIYITDTYVNHKLDNDHCNDTPILLHIRYCSDCGKLLEITRIVPDVQHPQDMIGFYNYHPDWNKYSEFQKITGENPYMFPSYKYEYLIKTE